MQNCTIILNYGETYWAILIQGNNTDRLKAALYAIQAYSFYPDRANVIIIRYCDKIHKSYNCNGI